MVPRTAFPQQLLSVVLLLSSLSSCVDAFTPLQHPFQSRGTAAVPFALQSSAGTGDTRQKSVVVISPPGGVGEVAAVKAAAMGSAVRWFVVGQNTVATAVVLAQEALDSIAAAGGSVELASVDAASLLLPMDDPATALTAVASWCGAADAMVCTFDGVEMAEPIKDVEDPVGDWKNAIKVAAKEASGAVKGQKLAILSASEEVTSEEEGGGIGGFVGNLFGGSKVEIPASLPAAMAADAASVILLRHGQLFGLPESSPDFSALTGGPRKQPELCEEYSMRTVRVDSTLSVSGNLMMGSSTRSSRHAVGEAAALMALKKVTAPPGLDVCVSSQRGTDPVDIEMWEQEFERCLQKISSGADAQLFAAEFANVPDQERLADWLTTKWATAVLRTYDIAAIRVGARPVYANRAGDSKLEIVWQELVDMNTVTVGKMVIEVTETGLTAIRGPGDASKGYGSISRKPLNGEDVLVRRLAEAVSQAIEKGLAKKVRCLKYHRIMQGSTILQGLLLAASFSHFFSFSLPNSPRHPKRRKPHPSQSLYLPWRPLRSLPSSRLVPWMVHDKPVFDDQRNGLVEREKKLNRKSNSITLLLAACLYIYIYIYSYTL
jgi:hypothetical protein